MRVLPDLFAQFDNLPYAYDSKHTIIVSVKNNETGDVSTVKYLSEHWMDAYDEFVRYFGEMNAEETATEYAGENSFTKRTVMKTRNFLAVLTIRRAI